MDFKRKAYDKLTEWKNRPNHKPIVVEGLRQVGKSYIVDKFAKDNYKNVVIFDFRYNTPLRGCFRDDLTVDGILSSASLYLGNPRFVPYETVLIFEEIGDCPEARSSLKTFSLDGRYDVIATGSLLGVANIRKQKKVAIPTGYEEFLQMTSMDFEEFLWAMNTPPEAIDLLKQHLKDSKELPFSYEQYFKKMMKAYMSVGGLPEVVASFVSSSNNYSAARGVLERLNHDYQDDFGRYVDDKGVERVDYNLQAKLNAVYSSIFSQLGREEGYSRFKVSGIEKGARASQYEEAMQWLEKAGLVLRVFNVSQIETPLKCNRDDTCYKAFISDIGLLMSNYPVPVVQQLINDELGSRKGAIYENLVAILLNKAGFPLYYFSNSAKHLEIDYLIETSEGIVLLEEKATNGKMAASRMVMEGKTPYKASKCVKVIENNFGEGSFFSAIPLYSLQYYLENLNKETHDVSFGDLTL